VDYLSSDVKELKDKTKRIEKIATSTNRYATNWDGSA
jgi:hypothetical protein